MNSMTGYGLGECALDNIKFKVEIKSLNNRYCEIFVKLPRNLLALEDKIRRRLKEKVFRGKFEVFVTVEIMKEGLVSIKPDLHLAKEYYKSLLAIKEELNIKDDVKLSQIYNMPNVLNIETKELDHNKLWIYCEKALNIALDNLINMRSNEGMALAQDFGKKLENLEQMNKELEVLAPKVLDANVVKLQDKINENLEKELLDLPRLTTEVSIMCDKLSVDEEITRIFSHISHFNDIIKMSEPVGRKMDFLLQELNREVNTVGSKSSDLSILNYVVQMKSEIEKIREQVQNIE